MSFQAPDTDLDPSAGFTAPADDLDPPKSLEGFLSNTISNAGRALNPVNLIKGTADQIKQGALDMPLEATNTLANKVAEAVGGEKDETAEKTPVEHLLQDPTMEKRAEAVGNSEPVQHPIDYAYKNPLDAALTVAAPVLPFLGEAEGAAGLRGTISKAAEGVGETEKVAPTLPEAEEAPKAPEVPPEPPPVEAIKSAPEQPLAAPVPPKIPLEGVSATSDPFSATKVINESGKPLTVYHGTDAKFDVFDMSNSGKNSRAFPQGDKVGYFFSTDKDFASGYGSVKDVHLNIKNPFSMTKDAFGDALNSLGGKGLRESLIAKGYDGIELLPKTEKLGRFDVTSPKNYVVFDANQIRNVPESAIPAAIDLKNLPVMQPGAKTGEPHALFAYNDNFGPGGTQRSIYNVFGDPGNPRINQVGGYGTSITKDILDQAGIPVVGREPRSVGKWEPVDVEATPSKTPAGEAGGGKAAPEPPKPPTGAQRLETAVDEGLAGANELRDYVSNTAGNYLKKPGAIADVADWVQAKSQMMAGQQIGITPNQFRQLGKTPLEADDMARAIGQYAIDQKLVDPGTSLRGMLIKNDSLIKSVGKTLGDFRKEADKIAGVEVDPKAVVAEVRKVLDRKYMRTVTNAEGEESGPRGAYGGQAGAYMRALQEIEDAEHSHHGIAQAATDLNSAANKAKKNLQPETPFTDVANAVSRINNEKVKALLGSEKAQQYEHSLREFGVNKKIQNALKFKGSGEVKRFGPGSTISNWTQKGMDELGYRFGAKAANKLSTAIKNNPSIGKSLPSLFKQFEHEVEDVANEATGMFKGGLVPDDIKRYVASRC